ncbi:hypothetical protein HDU79_011108 [Rhizoclosmatium sp. JEL0117]|nr:hypothetical protein HDU79_011108 [Rhizoclosmatium sp. JEL0117]
MFEWLRGEPDYAAVLQGIEDDIKKTEEAMLQYESLSIAWQAAILKYFGALYAVYLAAYFTVLSPANDPAGVWLIKVAVLTLVPVVIYYSRVLVDVWYKAKLRTSGRKLDTLRTTQKLKVEELKKKTGYYTTKNLLDKFDTPPKQLRPSLPKQVKTPATQPQNTMQTPLRPNGSETPFQTPNQQGPPGSIPAIHVQSAAPASAQSRWFDRVMDAVVGDVEGPQNKYALICQACFTHNGLVPPDQYELSKFKCMSCGALNEPHQYRDKSRGRSVDSAFSGASPSFGRSSGFGAGGMLGDHQDSRVGSPLPPGDVENDVQLEGEDGEQVENVADEVGGEEDAPVEAEVEPFQIQGGVNGEEVGTEKENVPDEGRKLRKRK